MTFISCHEVTLTLVSIFEERITFIIYTNLIFRQITLINAHSAFVPQVRIHCVLLSRTRYDDGGNRPNIMELFGGARKKKVFIYLPPASRPITGIDTCYYTIS